MNASSKVRMVIREDGGPNSAEQRLKDLGIKLPSPPGCPALPAFLAGGWGILTPEVSVTSD
jgi:hypothetical protein